VGRYTDGELIARSLHDPRAFTAVFDRHYETVLRYAWRMVGEAEGEELAAQTFEEAFVARARFDGSRSDSARTWLLGITHRLALRHFRDERKRLGTLLRLPAVLDEAHGFRPEAEDARRMLPAIRRAFAALSDEDRETYLLLVLGELNSTEAAEILGVPKGTVRSRRNRAQRILREHLTSETAIQEGRE
jgi:RNA polymerase sigma-70 factor (ECF subfamily)